MDTHCSARIQERLRAERTASRNLRASFGRFAAQWVLAGRGRKHRHLFRDGPTILLVPEDESGTCQKQDSPIRSRHSRRKH